MNNRQVNHEITLSRLATDKKRKDLRQAKEKNYGSSTGFANDFVSETEPVPFMREQNIEFNVTVLKPDTRHYAYWSGTDMTDVETNVIPKLLEVNPVSGSFEQISSFSSKTFFCVN